MSDDPWSRFKPSKSTEGTKKSAKISWKSDDLLKTPQTSTPDLFSIWDDQKRMDQEEKKMATELAETKRKAKELQKTLRKHQFGETKIKLGTKSKAVAEKSKSYFAKIKLWVTTNKKKSSAIVASAVVLVVVFTIFTNNKNQNQTDTLGESTSKIPISSELPRETPDFKLLFPINKSSQDYDIVRISPEGADLSYTYLDKISEEGSVFKVTQQQKPDNFDLEKVATEFQATNVIQIDGSNVYHGYSEKTKVQSLIFIKNDVLVSISSPEKFTDDQWANYIISMN